MKSHRVAPSWCGSHVAALGVALAVLGGCAHGRLPELAPDQWAAAPKWPRPPQVARIVWVGQLAAPADIVGSRGFFGWLGDAILGTTGEGTLDRPMGVAVDADGRLLVADAGLGAVVLFDVPEGRTTLLRDTSDGPLVSPIGVAVDRDGNIFVTDSARAVVASYTRDGEPLRLIGRGELSRPTGIAISADNQRLLISDTKRHEVAIYTPAGARLGTIGERGAGAGELNFPVFVAVDGDEVWVVDAMNARVQGFSSGGEVVGSFGSHGDTAGHFANPKGIAFDSEGHIYVADALFDNVQIFDRHGRVLLYFGRRGFGDGDLWLPEGITIDRENRIFVADALNHRVQIFRYLPAGSTP